MFTYNSHNQHKTPFLYQLLLEFKNLAMAFYVVSEAIINVFFCHKHLYPWKLISENSYFSIGAGIIPHQWLMVPGRIQAVVELPAVTAVIAETCQVTTEVRTGLRGTAVTHRILQVWVNLYL